MKELINKEIHEINGGFQAVDCLGPIFDFFKKY
jgi:hypothetical protein